MTFHTFATHAGPVYDITDIDVWSQNRCTHSHIYVTSKALIFNKKDEKQEEKKCSESSSFLKIHTPIHRPCGAFSIWFPFKTQDCDGMK